MIFGVLSGVAGLLAFLLPETLNKGLTETIREEIEEEKKVFHGNRYFNFFSKAMRLKQGNTDCKDVQEITQCIITLN